MEEFESPLPHCWRHKRKEETKPRWLGSGRCIHGSPWFHPGWGWQARTLLSPWHDALRRFYSELSGCEVSPQAAITATESTWPQ